MLQKDTNNQSDTFDAMLIDLVSAFKVRILFICKQLNLKCTESECGLQMKKLKLIFSCPCCFS